MMKRNIIINLLILSCFICISCHDNEKYDYPGDAMNKVYIRTLENTVNGFDKTSLNILKTPVNVFSDVLILSVHSTFKADKDISVSFSIDNALVENYNIVNKTSYKPLPVECMEIRNNELKILPGSIASKDMIEVRAQATNAINLEVGEYLMAVRIAEVTGNAEISSNRNAIYVIVTVAEDIDNIWDTEVNENSRGELLTINRTDWTMTNIVNSEFVGEIKNIFDDDEDSYVRYFVDSYDDNTGFIVDLQQEYSDISGIYQNYLTASYAITSSDIYTSLDNENWTYQGHFNNSKGIVHLCFYSLINARYIKFIVRESSKWGVFLREFNIYTKVDNYEK